MKLIVMICVCLLFFIVGCNSVSKLTPAQHHNWTTKDVPYKGEILETHTASFKTTSRNHLTKDARNIALAQALYHKFKSSYQEVFVLDYMTSFNHRGLPVPYAAFKLIDIFEMTSSKPGLKKNVLIFGHPDYFYSLAIVIPKLGKNALAIGRSLATLIRCGGIYAKSITHTKSIYQITSLPCDL